MSVETKSTEYCFGGKLLKLSHKSAVLGCDMNFNLYLPPQVASGPAGEKKVPLIMFLSGMTCTEDNCAQKGYFQHGASKRGIAVLYPDTSPRGLGIAGEDDSWDFGTGSGYYVNATADPYSKNYRMYDYVTKELPQVVEDNYGQQIDTSRVSLSGNSMGGHGAFTLFLRNPGKYKSASAFSPISNPLKCPWGQKAFKGYFGDQWETKGAEHDSTELMKSWKSGPIDFLVDVGEADNFYQQGQLLPENLVAAAKSINQAEGVKLRMHPGYTHSFYLVASFADDHVDHAAKYLFACEQSTRRQKL